MEQIEGDMTCFSTLMPSLRSLKTSLLFSKSVEMLHLPLDSLRLC